MRSRYKLSEIMLERLMMFRLTTSNSLSEEKENKLQKIYECFNKHLRKDNVQRIRLCYRMWKFFSEIIIIIIVFIIIIFKNLLKIVVPNVIIVALFIVMNIEFIY